MLGTPAYMAPEQARGEVDGLDERARRVRPGRHPVRGPDRGAALTGAILGEVLAPGAARGPGRRLRPGWTAAGPTRSWSRWRRRAWRRRRRSGRATAAEVAAAVAAYLAGVQERLRQAELERAAARVRAAEERKRRRVLISLAAVVLSRWRPAAGSGCGWASSATARRSWVSCWRTQSVRWPRGKPPRRRRRRNTPRACCWPRGTTPSCAKRRRADS